MIKAYSAKDYNKIFEKYGYIFKFNGIFKSS